MRKNATVSYTIHYIRNHLIFSSSRKKKSSSCFEEWGRIKLNEKKAKWDSRTFYLGEWRYRQLSHTCRKEETDHQLWCLLQQRNNNPINKQDKNNRKRKSLKGKKKTRLRKVMLRTRREYVSLMSGGPVLPKCDIFSPAFSASLDLLGFRHPLREIILERSRTFLKKNR